MQTPGRETIAPDCRKHVGRQPPLVLGQQPEDARQAADPRCHLDQQFGGCGGSQTVQVLCTTAQAKGRERVEWARWLAITVDAGVGRRSIAHGVRLQMEARRLRDE